MTCASTTIPIVNQLSCQLSFASNTTGLSFNVFVDFGDNGTGNGAPIPLSSAVYYNNIQRSYTQIGTYTIQVYMSSIAAPVINQTIQIVGCKRKICHFSQIKFKIISQFISLNTASTFTMNCNPAVVYVNSTIQCSLQMNYTGQATLLFQVNNTALIFNNTFSNIYTLSKTGL
jgi:hypothetical protein